MNISFTDLVEYAKPYASLIEGFDRLARGEWPQKVDKDGQIVQPDIFVYVTLLPVLFMGVIDHGLSPLQQWWIERYRVDVGNVPSGHETVPVYGGEQAQKQRKEALKQKQRKEDLDSESEDSEEEGLDEESSDSEEEGGSTPCSEEEESDEEE